MDQRQILYKKDGKGNSLIVGASSYKDSVITHLPEMNIGNVFEASNPRKDDIWIMTYPKSGTHWIYEIVGILLSGIPQPLTKYKEETFVELLPTFRTIEDCPSPRVINSHARVQFIPESVLNKCKLICVVRNPKSVAVSYYHHLRGVVFYDYEGSFDGYYDLFMQGIDDFYGSWFDYTTEWWDAIKERENALLISYEDMKKNPLKVITKIASFIEVSRDEEFCKEVVKLSSMETMAARAGKKADDVKDRNAVWKSGKHQMVRKGVIADWKNYFTVAQNEDFDKIYQTKMASYPKLSEHIQFE